jgi:hypothetical protein
VSLLALDPGIRGCGVARFADDRLVWCAYVKNPMKKGTGPAACASMVGALLHLTTAGTYDNIVVEWPRIYQRGGGKSKGDPNDLRDLCGVSAGLACYYRGLSISHVEPAEWKGQLPHEAVELRVLQHLSPQELGPDELEAYKEGLKSGGKTFGHNVTDAVGIGLHALGRFEPVRIIHRS